MRRNKARQSRVDEKNQQGAARNDGLQDEQKREGFSLSSAPKEKTVTVRGKKFEVPGGQLYCKKCHSTNFIYDDMKPPYFCADCGKLLKADTLQEINLDGEDKYGG